MVAANILVARASTAPLEHRRAGYTDAQLARCQLLGADGIYHPQLPANAADLVPCEGPVDEWPEDNHDHDHDQDHDHEMDK